MKRKLPKPDFLKAFKIFLSFSTLTAAAIGASLIGLKNRDKNDLTNNSATNHSSDINQPILNEINYLALGDSISAGFNWDYSFDFRGSISRSAQIKGLSYPAFFADFIQKIRPNAIKSFDNLALSWTTITDWLYLLEPGNAKFENFDKMHFNFNYELDKLTKSPYGQQIRDVFGNFSAKNYPKLKKKIQNANLLTLSLGANDLMESIDFRIVAKPSQKTATKAEAAFEFIQVIEAALEKISKNLQSFVQKIREINPNLQIVLLGYNALFSQSIKFFEKLLMNELGLPENYTVLTLKKLNETIKKVAKKQKVHFVDLYNEKTWMEKTNKFAKNEFDIHPSTKGYKKMAQDLLFKLAFEQDPEFKSEFVKKLNWNKDYLEKDQDTYRRILNIGSNLEIYKALSIDDSVEKFIAQKSKIEQISTAEIEKAKDPQLAILSRIWYETSFGTFLDRFLRSNVQINDRLKKMLNDFWLQNAKNNPSFSDILHKVLQSDFFLEIIERFQNYINDVTINQNWEKATISGLISFIFTGFSEKKLINVLKDVVSSDFASKNSGKIKEILFASIFGQSAIQDLLIDNAIGIPAEHKNDLKIIFTFESTRKLFSEIISDFILESKDYEGVKNFEDVLKIFLTHPQNYENIVKFAKSFIAESLKHRESVSFLVKILNENFKLNLEKDDQNSLISLLLSVSDIIIRTKTWEKLNDTGAKSFLKFIKSSDFRQSSQKISTIFANQIQATYATFFKKPGNLLDLFHELLTFDLSNNQIESLKKLLTKFYPIVNKFELSNFIDNSTPNYSNFSLFFNSIRDFLGENSFNVLSKVVNFAINDFLVNRSSYKQIDNLSRFGFQFLANNLPKIEENIYDYLAKNLSDENFIQNFSNLISKSLRSEGLSQKTVETFSKILQLIFEDFQKKYQFWKNNKTSNSTNNLIFEFVRGALASFKIFTTQNFDQYYQLKTNLERAEKDKKDLEIKLYKQKIADLDANLSFANFWSFFLNNFFTNDKIYLLLKELVNLNFKEKIGSQDLILFFKDLFSQNFLHTQLVDKLKSNPFFSQEKVVESLLDLLGNFFQSEQVEKLLAKFVDHFFSKEEFDKAADFSTFITNFLKENSNLIEEVFSLFLGDSKTWDSLSTFLKTILEASKVNLSEESIQTILTLVRDIFTKWKESTLSFKDGQKVQSPLTIQALIRILFDSISDSSSSKKSIFERLLDSFSVDIANTYYQGESATENQKSKINREHITKLFAEVARTNAIFEQIKAGLTNIPKDYFDNILPILNSFLNSPALSDLFDSYFKIVAKAKINKPLTNFSLIKTLFEKHYFTRIIGEFITKLDESTNLGENVAALAAKVFGTNFEKNEFLPFFKLIKEIILNNIENYYKTDENIENIVPNETNLVNVSESVKNSEIITTPFSETSENSTVSQGTEPAQTANQTEKAAIYSKENALLTKLVSVISNLTSGKFSLETFNLLLEKEIGTEEFIIELIKQVSSVYNKISETERDNLWNIIVKIFNSSFFKDKISLLNIGDVSSFSLFSNLSTEKKQKIEPLLKKVLLEFLPKPINKILIFRLLDYMNKNSALFKEVKTFSALLTKFLSDESNNNANNSQSNSQKESNSAFLKSYLWSVVDFLIKNNEFADLAADIIAVYLKLNLDNNENLTKAKIEKPREIITKFLKDFINLGLENPLLSGILDQIVQSIKTLDPSQKSASFFSAIFSKLDLAKLVNLDLVVKIEPKIGEDDSTGQSSSDQKDLIDEKNLTLKTPTNQKISTKSLADFFDLLFLASSKWDKAKENEASPILKELNHITYTGISFESIFKSNKKDPQLEAISKLFHRIWYSENNSSKIKIDNFKNSSKGRLLYRLVLILLFYTYESRISKHWARSTAFYGGLLSSYTASEIIRASLQNGEQANRNKTKDNDYKTFIDKVIGDPTKPKSSWWQIWTSYYSSSDVKLNDMLTMIYYNQEKNRFSAETGQEKLRDQVLEQIRQGTYPDNYQSPTKK
ncbi:SGNH/GDSL hydrolase family protein [Mesomycoplasma dispar]|uniref:SGNH/GDSL hydrolase family protein n=1 Tax=Mesomycoplasma dispar TaxID=86660 RepID=UPI0018E071ED|nr:SGNH/GDSL hydrolase family protein [Mesomycoplasma dispar]